MSKTPKNPMAMRQFGDALTKLAATTMPASLAAQA